MRNLLCLLLPFSLLLSLPAAAQDTKKKDPKEDYYGTWQYKTGVKAGTESTEEMLQGDVVINDKTFTLPGGPDQNFVMAYEMNLDESPAQIDFEIESGPISEGSSKGIIKIKDNVITLCYDPTGEDYPTKFESTEENGYHLFTMTKAGFDASKLNGDWAYTAGLRAGEEVSDESMSVGISIDGNEITIPVSESENFLFTYEVVDEGDPICIDITIEEGPQPGAVALGIMKIDGDKMTLCYDPMGQNRPTKFESTAENGFFLFKFKKDD